MKRLKLRAAAMLFRFVPVRAPVGRARLGHGPMAVRRARSLEVRSEALEALDRLIC